MKRILLILLVAIFSSTGCTVVGGVLGGASASSHNRALPQDHDSDEEASVGNRVVAGMALGLIVDALMMYRAMTMFDGFCIADGGANCSR